MLNAPTRRSFLRSAPLAAASLALADTGLSAQATAAPVPFQLFAAGKLAEDTRALQARPGNDNLFTDPALPVSIVLTVEEKHAAKEFEWHEGRDHIVQILDGTTLYEVGGTPQNGRNTRPGEWLAPASTGASSFTLHKGDMLLIPRGTPHKRSTADSVTFTLISTTGK